MKVWKSFGRTVAALLMSLGIGVPLAAQGAAGRTVGSYAVSPDGAATYSIPIWAPRGPNGLQPHISLVYNSQSGAGYVGVGWSISGLSSIYRCKRTFAQDPNPAPVTLTASDALCLDGQRLRLTGGSYEASGSTYQTEIANFANVTAYGTAGNGPAYFEVQARDGRTYEYGSGGGSQVTAAGTAWIWYLDKITDRAGNTMAISYTTENGTAVPEEISWTPSAYGATTYNYTVEFAYGTNAVQSSTYGYVAGSPYSNTNLLTAISVEHAGTTVRKYVLSYQQSPTTQRDELTEIQECADATASNCLAPTSFTYQNGVVGVSSSPTTIISGVSSVINHIDVNGDGIEDMAYCSGGAPGTIYVRFGAGSSSVNSNVPCGEVLFGDLTGSGEDGILAPNGTDWWYYSWKSGKFVGENTGLVYDAAVTQYVLADVNGDGLPDLIAGQVNSAGYSISVRLNTSSAAQAGFSSTSAVWLTLEGDVFGTVISNTESGMGRVTYGTAKYFDFNGDGRQDLVLQAGAQNWLATYELISQDSSFSVVTVGSQNVNNPAATTFVDLNSDGCTDYADYGGLDISGCNGTIAQNISLGGAKILGAMDWNGDGSTDILVEDGSTIGVYLAEGNQLLLENTSIPWDSSAVYFTSDIDGDGLDDLCKMGSSGVACYVHNRTGERPDLLSSITDGYGNTEKVSYVPYDQAGGAFDVSPVYPYELYSGPLYVVSKTTFSDPSAPPDGSYTQSFTYRDGWKNIQGRGFAGFGLVWIDDSRDGAEYVYSRHHTFPYTGMLSSSSKCEFLPSFGGSDEVCVIARTFSSSSDQLDGTQFNQRVFPYVSNVTEQDYVGDNDAYQPVVKTTSTNYTYDNYGNPLEITETTTDVDPNSQYDGESWTKSINYTWGDVDESTWCLGVLTQQLTTYSATDGSPSVTRDREYTPDGAYCRYKEIDTEPSSSTHGVIEQLGYDTFGNIATDSVTGSGMVTRQESVDWGATGQFPMAITDATGEKTQLNYDFDYGLVSKETDPNGLATSWVYGDGFGRLTQECLPDGTCSKWAYALNSGGPLARLIATRESDDAAGQLISTTQYYYDMLDRPLYRTDTTLDGSQAWTKILNYDSLGRIASICAPYFVGSTSPGCATYSYDILDRLTSVQRPVSQSDASQETTRYSYDGDASTITDPYGNVRTLVHDATGRLREARDPMGYGVTLGYDAAGSKISVTDSLGNTLWTGLYAYGIAPFLVGETDVDRGTWGYTVDALGERTAWTDAKGNHFYETYDALSRPLSRTEPDLFTSWTWGASAADHNIGKLASICTGTGGACVSTYYSEVETYDDLGRLYQRAISFKPWGEAATTGTYTWRYDGTTGALDTLTYPVSTSGKSLSLKYGYQNGLLKSVTDMLDTPNVTIWQADADNPAGQITQQTLGNGSVTNRSYDGVTGWLTSVTSVPASGAAVQDESFLYDKLGNVIQRQDLVHSHSENFYYDDDYRLSYSKLDGAQNLSLSYDQMGNITARSDVAAGATWSYDPVHVHQVTEAGSGTDAYVYDANGNVTSRGGTSITWSTYNYPLVISDADTGESVSFVYGPDRRAWTVQTKNQSGTAQDWRFGRLLHVYYANGVVDYRHYVYAGNEPVAIISRKNNGVNLIHYLLTDQQGSIAAITDKTGAVKVGESFAAFGSRRDPGAWSGAAIDGDLATIAGLTYAGYTFQDALGSKMELNNMVGRVEDAVTGRFLSADPTLQLPEDPQDYNSYSYVLNNPVTFADPTGFGCDFDNFFVNGCDVTAPPEPPNDCIECAWYPNFSYPSYPGWPEAPFRSPSAPPQAPPARTGVPSAGRTPASLPKQVKTPKLEDCLAGGGGGEAGAVQQQAESVAQGATALEGGAEAAAHAGATTVGKWFAGATLMTVGGDQGYQALGEDVQSVAESVGPLARGTAIAFGVLGPAVAAAGDVGNHDLSGAASISLFGATDFAVDLALSSLEPGGPFVAVAYSRAGGSRAAVQAAGSAVMCSAKLGIPPPMIFRQVR